MECRAKTEFFPSNLPIYLYPFRPGSDGKPVKYITNGSKGKAPFALAIGLELMEDPGDWVKMATGVAEDSLHAHVQTRFNLDKRTSSDIFAPSFLNEVPYSLILAKEKLKAAKTILGQNSRMESFITTDSAYELWLPGQGYITIHKPVTEVDREEVARFMWHMSQTGQAKLYSVTGVARYDEASDKSEFFTIKQDLGTVQQFDMATFLYKIRDGSYKSLGLSSHEAMGLLVPKKDFVDVTVTKFQVDESSPTEFMPEGRLTPVDQRTIQTGTEDHWLQFGGIGFIPWDGINFYREEKEKEIAIF